MTQIEDPTEAFAGRDAVSLELEDIQGDILRAYGNQYDCTTYVFLAVPSVKRGRELIADLADLVTDAAPWTVEAKPERHFNVALTCSGLQALGVPAEVIESFSPEFRIGMAGRAERLGDVGPSDPAKWESGFGTGAAHVLVTVNALDPGPLASAMEELDALIARHGPTVVARREAELMPDIREHFGFADGFSQPAVVGATDDKAPGGGVPLGDGTWRALQPGEFVLGYPDEDTVLDPERRLPAAPVGPLGRNGTYMVWRRLHQDVARFRQVVQDAAERYEDGDEEKLRAKIVGRWDDGSPLTHFPDAPATAGADGTYDQSAPGANDFTFRHSGDESGARCPLGSHIRRSNPRDALGWNGALSFRHRIIRRGMPYGPRLPEGVTEDDGAERGLVFISFQANLARQFEAIQVQWLNDGNVFGLGHDVDFIMGTHRPEGGSMVIQGDCPFYLGPQDDFVTMRGGEYLFVPGISALRAVATGQTAPS